MSSFTLGGVRPRRLSALSRFSTARLIPVIDSLLVLALVIDLLTPYLVWKGLLPGSVSWLSQILTAAVVAFAYTRMMFLDQIPAAVLVVVGVTAFGLTSALFRGQDLVATLWGWWGLFKYPLVGVYAYLRANWPDRFGHRLSRICLALLGFEVAFQIGQYLSGEPIGDNLAGTFGWHGVGPLLFFTVFVMCLALGEWLTHGRWLPLLLALSLGTISGVLGENKVFAPVALLLVLLTIVLLVLRGSQTSRMLSLVALLTLGLVGFVLAYNAYVPSASRRPLEQIFLNETELTAYVNRVHRSNVTAHQTYNLGRNLALEYAFSTISGDPVSLLFGLGLGTRSSSQSLGTTGLGLEDEDIARGSNLVVMLQEMGLLGAVAVVGFTLWVSAVLFRHIRHHPQSPATPLRYAVLLFSALWPFWLWYKNPLGSRVAMLLYWVSLGYVLYEARQQQSSAQAVSAPRLAGSMQGGSGEI